MFKSLFCNVENLTIKLVYLHNPIQFIQTCCRFSEIFIDILLFCDIIPFLLKKISVQYSNDCIIMFCELSTLLFH